MTVWTRAASVSGPLRLTRRNRSPCRWAPGHLVIVLSVSQWEAADRRVAEERMVSHPCTILLNEHHMLPILKRAVLHTHITRIVLI